MNMTLNIDYFTNEFFVHVWDLGGLQGSDTIFIFTNRLWKCKMFRCVDIEKFEPFTRIESTKQTNDVTYDIIFHRTNKGPDDQGINR